nr:MAG TPA: hypothetical protein [Caudoviricetes sp.]
MASGRSPQGRCVSARRRGTGRGSAQVRRR